MNSPEQIFGYSALERMAETPHFNHWMYQVISPYLKGKILEIGSGIGNLSTFFIRDHKDITISDYDNLYLQLLKNKFSNYSSEKIIHLNLADEQFKEKNANLKSSFDSIFLLNVLEHIHDDYGAIDHCKFLLKEEGSLLILVPSYSFLYSKMDRMLGHYRRYTSSSLNEVLKVNNLEVEKTYHFNALGIAGWWWNKIFDEDKISRRKITAFNKIVPLAKIIDKLTFNKIGLSVISIAKKTLF